MSSAPFTIEVPISDFNVASKIYIEPLSAQNDGEIPRCIVTGQGSKTGINDKLVLSPILTLISETKGY